MRLSNGIPIQFWLNGQETFNQKSVPGVDQTAFNQLFNPDDNIVIQFTDTVLFGYQLSIVDTDGNTLETIPFDIIPIEGGYVYSLSFTFDDYSITGTVRLNITYFGYELSGGAVGLLGTVEGEAINTETFLIEGGVNGLIGSVEGEMVNGVIVYINNDTSTGSLSVTGLNVLGPDVFLPDSFPITAGNDLTGKIQTAGSKNFLVLISVDTPAHNILVIDSELNSYCQDIDAAGTYSFPGLVCNGESQVSIIITEGSCS
jgi:hypothetical protein